MYYIDASRPMITGDYNDYQFDEFFTPVIFACNTQTDNLEYHTSRGNAGGFNYGSFPSRDGDFPSMDGDFPSMDGEFPSMDGEAMNWEEGKALAWEEGKDGMWEGEQAN